MQLEIINFVLIYLRLINLLLISTGLWMSSKKMTPQTEVTSGL